MREMMRFVVLSCLICGCGGESGPPRFDLEGTVTYDGKPVPAGKIYFTPATSDPAVTDARGDADIIEGAFSTVQSGQGHLGGRQTVRIEGYDGDSNLKNDFHPLGNPIFKYTEEIELPQEASHHAFEVPRQKK